MAEFTVTKTLDVSPDQLWAVAADMEHASRWLPTAFSSSGGDEQVQLPGESHGHPYDTTAPVTVDAQARRLSWSSSHGPGYRGWLQVGGVADRAEVTVHLEIDDERPATAQPDEVERGMAESLDRLGEVARR